MKNELNEINYIRVIAIFSIVIWHCSLCPLLYWELFDVEELPHKLLLKIISFTFFPDAVMPLFTFISGYLFCYLVGIGKYSVFKEFLTNKVNRLIIPFIIVGTLVNITSYDRHISSIPWGEGSHLWFCCMLFWCFIITWLIKEKTTLLYLFLGLSVLLQVAVSDHFNMFNIGFKLPLGIHQSLYYLGYFISGYLVYIKREILIQYRSKILYLSFVYLLLSFVCILEIQGVSKIAFILHNYMYSIILAVLFANFRLENLNMERRIGIICRFGFGIYVFHEWISWNFCHIPDVKDFIREHYYIFPFINFIWIMAVSYVLTGLFLKTKIGRYLLL